ncbi:hypothetical protein Bca52824_055048 [Brassica carinata]|uniref:Uncharacterized protein n=1 Tax=Brassica carinata TaxID=52824 RepID=A0A8X7R9J3_BRACI|nr:hypothetical protein Bca52824_055048 [Brassica carinata]
MRKSVSLNNLSEYRHTDDIPKIIAEDEKNKTSSGYVSADDAVPISSSRERKQEYWRVLVKMMKSFELFLVIA